MAKSRRAPEDEVRRPHDEDEDDAPRRKGRKDDDDDDDEKDAGPIVPRRKKKSAAGPVKIVLRIIGAVLGAVGLGIFLYWVYSPVGTDHSMLCYFPKETTSLSGYDFDEVMKNAKMSEVHTMILTNYKVFGDKRWSPDCGVKDTDVLKYMSGHASGDPEEEKDLPPQQKRGDLTVLRFKREVDEGKFVASFTGTYQCREDTAKDGRKFYQLWWKKKIPPDMHEEEEPDISFFFPNKTTLVYGTTRRELLEAMTRTPGKVVVEGTMKDLADKVDGHYFTASGGWEDKPGYTNSVAFGLGFTGDDFKDANKYTGVVGTASWFASNGNDFLYASANLYGDLRTAKAVRAKLAASYGKAQADIWQNDSGKPGGLVDPFNPAVPKEAVQAPGGGLGGGMAAMGGPRAVSNEQTKDIMEALAAYAAEARVYRRDKLVVVEGTIPHGTPEQGVFEKFWHAINQKFMIQNPGGLMGGGGMGMPMGGPPPPGGGGLPMGGPPPPGGAPAPGGGPPGPPR